MSGGRRRAGAPGGRRRGLVDFSGGQLADVQLGQAAGGNIQHGTDSDMVLDFFKEYVFLDRQEREKRVLLKDAHDRYMLISVVVIIVMLAAIIILLLLILERLSY